MILLAVETGGTTGSLALTQVQNKKILCSQQTHWNKKSTHSEVITVELQNLLDSAKLKLNQLTHLAVNIGPGSFTGLRVGISLTKTLAFGLDLPVAPLGSLEVLAFKFANRGESIFVATRAIQKFFYVAAYLRTDAGLELLLEPQSLDQNQLPEFQRGYAKVLIEGETPNFSSELNGEDLTHTLLKLMTQNRFFPWKDVKPLYIRASEAEEKLRKGLLTPL